jgi:hypothetical protein
VASSLPVVTVIDRGPSAAPGATVNCAVSVVPFATLILLTVILTPAFTCITPVLKLVFKPLIVTSAGRGFGYSLRSNWQWGDMKRGGAISARMMPELLLYSCIVICIFSVASDARLSRTRTEGRR